MDRAIHEWHKQKQRRVKSSSSARLVEAQRRTGGSEHHLVVALHKKCVSLNIESIGMGDCDRLGRSLGLAHLDVDERHRRQPDIEGLILT